MSEHPSSCSQSSESASALAAHSGGAAAACRGAYSLTIKRGILALVIMFGFQTLVGIGLSYGARFIWGADAVNLPMIGMASVLIGGSLVLLWVWGDIRRFGPSFMPQIGLRRGTIQAAKAVVLVLLLVGATHLLAWVYRSVILPQWGQGGIVGGGSEMFARLQESGSALGMTGFLALALLVGPVMEEVVFRGYLQSALARRMPAWAAITITSVVFTLGHGPAVLWPMYFLYSVAWGWIFVHTRSLQAAIASHVLSNAFYTVVAVMGWEVLA